MKIAKLLFLLLLLLICCTACESQENTPSVVYQVYFPPKSQSFGDPALGAEQHAIKEGEEAIPELLRLLLEGPKGERLQAILPEGLLVRDWNLKSGVLSVDFSSGYGLLSGIDLTLADYSVTITLSQVPGVETVVTSVEGDPITYRDRESLKGGDVFFSLAHAEQSPA